MATEFGKVFKPTFSAHIWNRLDIQSVFSGANFEDLKNGFTPDTYQSWLGAYYLLIAKTFPGLRSPLDLKIGEAKSKFNHYPLWALTFSRKKFKDDELHDEMLSQIVNKKYRTSEYWAIERELIKDKSGESALVERLLDDGGKMQRLTILRVNENFPYDYLCRREDRFDKGKYAAIEMPNIRKNLVIWELFRSDHPIQPDLRS